MSTQARIPDEMRRILTQCAVPPREGEHLLTAIAHRFNLTPDELRQGGNEHRYVVPRHIAMYLLYEKIGFSLPHIGKVIGQHHTTVLRGIRKIAKVRLLSPELDAIIREFEK